MRDRQLCKTSISSERTLQTVTIAVMLVDCTKLVYTICQLSSNVIWLKTEMTHYASTEKNSQHTFIHHYDWCTDCLLSLQIVQNFYTSQSLGGPQTPPAPLNDAIAFRRSRRSAHTLRYIYTAAAAAIAPAAATRIVVCPADQRRGRNRHTVT